ncbi:MAG: hypothetical protein KatS3mg088_583 [Patescibacteria group bacterium]|nr:MAG: hypothetical protein KatS3mg088_583 [Patescibacteria group bacterium]
MKIDINAGLIFCKQVGVNNGPVVETGTFTRLS